MESDLSMLSECQTLGHQVVSDDFLTTWIRAITCISNHQLDQLQTGNHLWEVAKYDC
jgi:hypothetical protein